MDLNVYHKAWMQGFKESECVRMAEEAYFENQNVASQKAAYYVELEKELEREHYEELYFQHLEELKEQE